MSGSHEKLPRLFWVQIVLVLIVGVLYLFAPSPEGHGGDAVAKSPEQQQMIAALDPIGSVALAKEEAAPGAARSGAEVVAKTCAVCHSIGLANAPKLEAGAKGDWEARMAGGMDALVASAITGKGGMPPRGGDPTLTDEEMHDAIVDMLASANIEVAEAAPAESAAPAAVAKSTEVTAAARSGDEIVKKTCAVCHSIGLANAPKLDAAAKGDWETRMAGGMDALVASAITGKGGMPPRGGDPTLSDEEMNSAIVSMLASSGVEVAEAAPAPAAESVAPAVDVAQSVEATPTAVAEEVNVASVASTKEGESTYKAACFACHDTGVANSPIIGDKVAWAARLELGMSALYNTAVNGDSVKPTMPAKGGNPSLSDEAVKAAVNHMVSMSR